MSDEGKDETYSQQANTLTKKATHAILAKMEAWTKEGSSDEATRHRLEQFVKVLEGGCLKGIELGQETFDAALDTDANKALLDDAKERLTKLGAAKGLLTDTSATDVTKRKDDLQQFWKEKEKVIMDNEEVQKALADGKTLYKEVIDSVEAQKLKDQSSTTIKTLSETEEGKRIAETAKALYKDHVDGFLDKAPAFIESHLRKGSDYIKERDFKQDYSKLLDATENAGSNEIVKQFRDSLEEQKENRLEDLAEKTKDSSTLALATNVVNAVKKDGLQGLEGEEAKTAMNTMLVNSKTLVDDMRTNKTGQQALSKSLNYLNFGMEHRVVQEAVKQIGSEEVSVLAKRAVDDPEARKALLEKIRVLGIDLLLRSLPSISMAPISGLSDDVAYVIDGLDLSGFQVPNEQVSTTWGDVKSKEWNGEVLNLKATGMSAVVKGLTWCFRQTSMLGLSGQGKADCFIDGITLNLGFKLVRHPQTSEDGTRSCASSGVSGGEEVAVAVPGTDNVHLVLASKSLEVEKFDLKIEGSSVSWIYNTLLGMFQNLVREYMVENVLESLDLAAEEWLGSLNKGADSINLAPIIAKMTSLDINNLEVVQERRAFLNAATTLDRRSSNGRNTSLTFLVEVVFGPGPIGFELAPRDSNKKLGAFGAMIRAFKTLPNGDMGPAERLGVLKPSMILQACNQKKLLNAPFPKIMDTLRKATRPIVLHFFHDPDVTLKFMTDGNLGLKLEQENGVTLIKGFDTVVGQAEKSTVIHPGHLIHAVAGRPVTIAAGAKRPVTYGRLISFLKKAKRPITIRFGPDEQKMPSKVPKFKGGEAPAKPAKIGSGDWVDVVFGHGALGMKLMGNPSGQTTVISLTRVDGLVRRRGEVVQVGMAVTKLNNTDLHGVKLEKVANALNKTKPPRLVTFTDLNLQRQLQLAQQDAMDAEAKEKANGASR